MHTIYIDILLCVNLVINYLLLSAVSFYTHARVSTKRLLLGSLVGAICSLIILLPDMMFIVNALLKLAAGALTVYSAFGKRRFREFAVLYAVFLTATFFFGGIVIALWFLFTPKNLLIKNSTIYLDISPVMLIVYSMICYAAFRGLNTVTGKREPEKTFCSITICNRGSKLTLTGKIDTGSTLKEPFSQCPVIVAGRDACTAVTPKEIAVYESVSSLKYREAVGGVRFVPFTSVNGKGIMPSFKPEEVYINGLPVDKNVYIALCPDSFIQGEFSAIIPYDIF